MAITFSESVRNNVLAVASLAMSGIVLVAQTVMFFTLRNVREQGVSKDEVRQMIEDKVQQMIKSANVGENGLSEDKVQKMIEDKFQQMIKSANVGGNGISEAQVQEMIDAANVGGNGISEAQVQEMIKKSGGNGLSEAQVQDMIKKSGGNGLSKKQMDDMIKTCFEKQLECSQKLGQSTDLVDLSEDDKSALRSGDLHKLNALCNGNSYPLNGLHSWVSEKPDGLFKEKQHKDMALRTIENNIRMIKRDYNTYEAAIYVFTALQSAV